MLERTDLSDESIDRCLQENYGTAVKKVTFLPIGYDSAASVFRVEGTDHVSYFLKIKTVPVNESVLHIPHFLRDHGIKEVVAPLSTQSGQLSAPLADGMTAILYPFVEGRMGAKGGLSLIQWTALGQMLRRIHGAEPPTDLVRMMRQERFVPLKVDLAWRLHREMSEMRSGDPLSLELAACWRGRSQEIEALFLRAEELGRLAHAHPAPLLLCHADIHIFNVLVDVAENIWVIDWDEAILAPKERDLMFLVASADARAETDPNELAFRAGYGPTVIDPVILAFYRYDWVVQEIAEFGKQVLDEHGGELTRRDGLRHFRALFDPGNVVEGAYCSDT